MPWTKTVTVGRITNDITRSVTDSLGLVDDDTVVAGAAGGVTDTAAASDAAAVVRASVRAPADAAGVTDTATADLVAASGPTTADIFGNATTHPAAVFTRSGNWLTAPGRWPIAVFDEDPGFTLGTTEPTWANTAETTAGKTTYTGTTANLFELVTSFDGQVIENLYLPNARIRIKHKNVTIRHCLIGIGWYSGRTLIQNNCAVVCDFGFDTTGWVLDHVTCDPQGAGDPADPLFASNPNSTAIVSAFYMIGRGAAYRCAARNVTDGFMPDNPSVGASTQAPYGPAYLYGNYVQTRWLSYDPEQSDGTHNDGVQYANGDAHVAIGNAFVNPDTAGPAGVSPRTASSIQGQCILLDPYHEPTIVNPWIEKNWIYGAYSQFANWNPSNEGGPGVQGVVYRGNRHGGSCVYPILTTPGAYGSRADISGNVAAPVSVNNSRASGGLIYGDGQNITLAPGAAIPVTQVARG